MVSMGPGATARVLRVALLSLVLALSAAPAAARQLEVERFHSTIRVHSDGSVLVRETLDVHFIGKWQGLSRSVPLRPPGSARAQEFELCAVTDGQGAPLRYELSQRAQRAEMKVHVPGATDTRKTIVLEYELSDVAGSDVVAWNVTGNDWDMPLGHVSAELLLPESVSEVEAQSFTGEPGSTRNRGELSIAANRVAVLVPGTLPPHQGLTLLARWTASSLTAPPATAESPRAPEPWLEPLFSPSTFDPRLFLDFDKNGWLLALPGGALGILFGLWCIYGRNPRPRRVVVRFTPPGDLTPAELSRFIGCDWRKRNIVATVLDLAVRGYVHIRKIDGSAKSRAHYAVYRLDGEGASARLQSHEQAVLDRLCERGAAVTHLGSVGRRRGFDLRTRLLASEIELRGYYESRPTWARSKWVLCTVTAMGVSPNIWMLGLADCGPAVVAVLLAGAILCSFAWMRPRRTIEGSRAFEHGLGFAEFLRQADPARFARELREPGVFERYLPYAIALGAEDRWSEAFQKQTAEPLTFPWCPGDLVELNHVIHRSVYPQALVIFGVIEQVYSNPFAAIAQLE